MNRLILIGNGFDLAHGMKTSYNSFITNYVVKAFQESEKNRAFEDNLMKITQPYSFFNRVDVSKLNAIEDFIPCMGEETKGMVFFNGIDSFENSSTPKQYKWEVFNPFIKTLIKQCADYNWVDIENEYYDFLKLISESFLKNDGNAFNKIVELNETFFWLINYLESYLSELDVSNLNTKILNLLNAPIYKNEIVTKSLEDDKFPNSTMILNFNYTSTIEQYIKKIPKAKRDTFDINYIHGKLNDLDNPIIFGYGDEVDSHYLKMEELGVNSLFDYIKSFWYFKTSNYHNLIRFIESDDYQIYVMGHSCGLSDRTMLKMIFEHENCKSIKLHYYQTEDHNNFTELTQQISRHFTDKGLMRKKIVPFEKSIPLPQWYD